MKIKDILLMCFGNLKRRKGRTILSVLGVVIGCCSIVCMMSIGVGLTASQEAWISEMGDLTSIDVYAMYSADVKLDDALVDQVKAIQNVKSVAAKLSLDEFYTNASAGNKGRYKASWTTVAAYDSDVMNSIGYVLEEGQLPQSKGTVAIGQYFEYALYDSKRPDGRNTISYYDEETWEPLEGDALPKPYVSLMNDKFTISVIGDDGKEVYSEEFKVVGKVKQDYNAGSETDSGIIMRSEDIKNFIFNARKALGQKKGDLEYSSVKVFADEMDNVSTVEESIKSLGYDTSSLQSMRESTQKEMNTIQLALGGIGAVSLIVAAIGIMNTMIMSVSERTKEIGIMKALGCYVTDIRKLFLLEASAIGLIGGTIGSILSYIISMVINFVYYLTGNAGEIEGPVIQYLFTSDARISVIPVWLFLFGLIFSMLIGLVSGAYPAVKAVKISPLEAMKNE